MSHLGQTTSRKKRAKRFQSTKMEHDARKQLERVRDEVTALVQMSRRRALTLNEGRELSRLSIKLRRLEHKLTKKNM